MLAVGRLGIPHAPDDLARARLTLLEGGGPLLYTRSALAKALRWAGPTPTSPQAENRHRRAATRRPFALCDGRGTLCPASSEKISNVGVSSSQNPGEEPARSTSSSRGTSPAPATAYARPRRTPAISPEPRQRAGGETASRQRYEQSPSAQSSRASSAPPPTPRRHLAAPAHRGPTNRRQRVRHPGSRTGGLSGRRVLHRGRCRRQRSAGAPRRESAGCPGSPVC
jgi:hypothetical protein